MTLLKAILMLSTAFCHYVSLTPPLPPPPPNELVKVLMPVERVFRHIVRSFTAVIKITGCAVGLCEVAVILAHQRPSPALSKLVLSTLVRGPAHSAASITITPVFLVGCALVMLGAAVRIQCYRTLGRLFTFELALRRNHELVTHGPYTVVRHPSYTALLAGCSGIALCHVDRGSWLRECGALDTLGGKAVAYGWMVCLAYATMTLSARTLQEDRVLQKEFGEQWTRWAGNVRYRLFPGIW
ncbi:hypothetical protein B0H21DRAFT_97132 [Amylocystis lapponica]|nr:hypothetical protein B0H21DRAFT_97132 [Amylocystis lapponica]